MVIYKREINLYPAIGDTYHFHLWQYKVLTTITRSWAKQIKDKMLEDSSLMSNQVNAIFI